MKSVTETRGPPAHNPSSLIFRKERAELTIPKSRIVVELLEKREILFYSGRGFKKKTFCHIFSLLFRKLF